MAGLIELLRPERLTAVVDVGANPIDGDPPYKQLLQMRGCRVTGFEPQADALAALNARKSEFETYLPNVIADGKRAKLHVCHAPGMTSLLKPSQQMLGQFRGFPEWGKVVREIPVETSRLDDVVAGNPLDLLKIDIQGSELTAIENGRRCLARAVAVQCEVSFLPLYEDQPTHGAIDRALSRLGFVPHAYAAINRRMIGPLFDQTNPFAAMNQLLEADIVYVRDFTRPDDMQIEQLKHLAIIAHYCYRSFDLAANCIHHLERRGAVLPGSLAQYPAMMKT